MGAPPKAPSPMLRIAQPQWPIYLQLEPPGGDNSPALCCRALCRLALQCQRCCPRLGPSTRRRPHDNAPAAAGRHLQRRGNWTKAVSSPNCCDVSELTILLAGQSTLSRRFPILTVRTGKSFTRTDGITRSECMNSTSIMDRRAAHAKSV